jgi:hypothetical protein
MSSRLNGDLFEYSLVWSILTKATHVTLGNRQSIARFASLKSKVKSKVYMIELPRYITRFVDTCGPIKIEINSDNDGVQGCSNDISLVNKSDRLGISLKYNNFSIKHPRSAALHNHFTPSDDYHKEYVKLNKKWYDYCIQQNYTQFLHMEDEHKRKLYTEFTELMLTHITTISQVRKLITFCTCDTEQYVMHLQKTHRSTKSYYISNKFDQSDTHSIIRESYNTILVTLGPHVFTFRLHNASSCITNTLSLKYDVKTKTELYELVSTDPVKVLLSPEDTTITDKSRSLNLLKQTTEHICKGKTNKGQSCKNIGKYEGYCHHHKI